MGSQPAPGTYSASRVSALIGLNPFQTSLEAFQTMQEEIKPGWNSAHGYTLPEKPDSAALRWGSAFESAIIKLAEEKEGCQIINKEKYYSKKIGDVTFSTHIDGQFASGFNTHPVLHEGKTSNHWAFSSVKKEIVDALDEKGELSSSFQIIQKWGSPNTDETAQEYQIQCGVQRICTGAELVKLSVLVFPKGQDEFEDMGWKIVHGDKIDKNIYMLMNEDRDDSADPDEWAMCWAQQGNFHTYQLPSNPELEKAIIESVQRFHENNFIPGVPPDSQTFADVRRILPNPIGSVLATPELAELCREYSELTKQLGSTSPASIRKEALKTIIADEANGLKRTNGTDPNDKFIIIDPHGGEILATLKKNKNGVVGFSSKRAT